MSSYTQLIAAKGSAGSIASWVNSTAIEVEAPTILSEAQGFIYQRLRHWRMLTSTSGTATASTTALTLPTGFVRDKRFRITGTAAATLARKPIQEVIDSQWYNSSGARVAAPPSVFSNDGANFQFDTMLDKAYPFTLWFYQRPTALSTSNNTNFLTDSYPRLLRCSCMIGAAEFMKDNGLGNYDRSYWEAEAEREIANAQIESDLYEQSIEVGAIIE